MMPSPITPTVPFDFPAIPIFLMMKIAKVEPNQQMGLTAANAAVE
jgi:hypothetical protein